VTFCVHAFDEPELASESKFCVYDPVNPTCAPAGVHIIAAPSSPAPRAPRRFEIVRKGKRLVLVGGIVRGFVGMVALGGFVRVSRKKHSPPAFAGGERVFQLAPDGARSLRIAISTRRTRC
jgi:hypothetical protein